MKTSGRKTLKLNLQAAPAFLPIAVTFIEKSALALGLEEREALLLTLAGEEIFLHLCQQAPDQEVEIQCIGEGYEVRTEFLVVAALLDLKAFNLTTQIKPEEEDSLEALGLVLASRSVDRFEIWEEKGQGLHLCLIKEKAYPPAEPLALSSSRPLSQYRLKTPDREEVKLLAQMALSIYPSHVLPVFFSFPGKVADMAAAGAFKAVIAVDPQGHLGGGLLWYWRGPKIVVCSGPYLINQSPDSSMADTLVEFVLEDIARSKAVGLLSRYPTAELPLKYFEPLGSFSFFPSQGPPLSITAYFRQMQEDPGSLIWSHADLEPFLDQELQRRTLPRERRLISDYGESRNPFSVLSAGFDRGRNLVTLKPMRPGKDQERNIADHLQLLKLEGWRNIFFQMDLGKSWQVEFTPALLAHAFRPSLLLPYAGEGDLLLFQAEAAEKPLSDRPS